MAPQTLVLYKYVDLRDGKTKFYLESTEQWRYLLTNYIRLEDLTYKLVKIAEIGENELQAITEVLAKESAKISMEASPLEEF